MKVQELIDLINNTELYSLWDAGDLINGRATREDSGQDLSEHRWFSIATDIYKCEDGFVGVRGAYQSFSESQTWSDIDVLCTATEYKAVPTIKYVPKV